MEIAVGDGSFKAVRLNGNGKSYVHGSRQGSKFYQFWSGMRVEDRLGQS